jgi:lysophospholipase L1-like esterase
MSNSNIKVYLAGDSIVQTYNASSAPQAGWGQFIGNYFEENVEFVNRAIGGRSSKSFVVEGRLDKILEELKEGDYLFIQLGHNDSTVEKPERYTEPTTEYKKYLKVYIDGAREKKATPVLFTPIPRLIYKEGVFESDFHEYCKSMKELAETEKVQLIDAMTRTVEFFNATGYDEVYTYFMVSVNNTDYCHFTEKGADKITRIVVQGIKESSLYIAKFIK